jgi:hypothetical protein
MQKSLKVFIHDTLAKALGRAPVTLYERQRPLVAAGLLHAEDGRGPGSGVKAEPRSVAMLLVSVLATDTASDADAVTAWAKFKCLGGHPCDLTDKTTLVDAITTILEMGELPKVVWLQAARRIGEARITYPNKKGDGFEESIFTRGGKPAPDFPSGFITSVAMHNGLHEIAKALKG